MFGEETWRNLRKSNGKKQKVKKLRKSKEKLFKSEESYPNARETHAPESVQFKDM